MRDLSRGVQLGLRAAAALLSLLVLVGSGVAWATYRQFSSAVPHGAAVPASADSDGTSQNILLLGNDSRAGATPAELRALNTQDDGGSVNTDTIMLLHVPADGGKASVVSFPRDAWVPIPGHGNNKINAAYPAGYNDARGRGAGEVEAESAGIDLLIRTIDALTGLHVDHYVQVNLLGFYRISTAIGGVDVCLNAAQNPETDSDAYGKGYSGINLPAGVSHIQGSQALAFVRQRHGLPGGDLDRIRRQQYFLAAAFAKVTSSGMLLNPFKLHSLLDAVSSSLMTDPNLDLASLAGQFADLSSGALTFQTLPNNGSRMIYPDGIGTSIIDVDSAAIPAFVARLEGRPADPQLAGAAPARPSSVTVDVLNATSAAGLAGRNADALRRAGFTVAAVDSTDPAQATSIEYPPAGQSAAKAVAAVLPGAGLVETASVSRVTVVLGADGLQVNGAQPPSPSTSGWSSGGSSGSSSGRSAGDVPTPARQGTAAAPAGSGASPGPTGLGCIN